MEKVVAQGRIDLLPDYNKYIPVAAQDVNESFEVRILDITNPLDDSEAVFVMKQLYAAYELQMDVDTLETLLLGLGRKYSPTYPQSFKYAWLHQESRADALKEAEVMKVKIQAAIQRIQAKLIKFPSSTKYSSSLANLQTILSFIEEQQAKIAAKKK